MPISQEVLGQFRRKRLLISVTIAILVLVGTLTFRFFQEINDIERQSRHFADRAIERFDRQFSPLDLAANNALGLVGLPCEQVRFPLIEKLAALQTIRTILLVDHNQIYCSSIYGTINSDFSADFPDLAIDNQRMVLTNDRQLLKGSAVLLLWTPQSPDNQAGILQAINIELMTSYLLEPTLPWVERAVINVGAKVLNMAMR